MKIFTPLFLIVLFWLPSAVNATILALVDSVGGTYYLEGSLEDYAGNLQFRTCYVSDTGKDANGIVFYDPAYAAYKIVVFENDDTWGFTIEGHWTGNESTGYQATNNGNAIQLTLSVSDLTNTTYCGAGTVE